MRDNTELQTTEYESVDPKVLAMREKFIASMDLTPEEAQNMRDFELDKELFDGFHEGALEMSEEQENASFSRLIEGLQHVSE